MSKKGRALGCLGLVLATGLAGCNGKPEDTGQGSDTAQVQTPAPPYPAWSGPMIGKGLREVSHGVTTCKGEVDLVSVKHMGRRPGSEIEGWGWDLQAGAPLARVLFTDQSDRVVGAASVGNLRPDVKAAVVGVKTPAVGWKGVAGVTSGPLTAVGLSATGASCVVGNTNL